MDAPSNDFVGHTPGHVHRPRHVRPRSRAKKQIQNISLPRKECVGKLVLRNFVAIHESGTHGNSVHEHDKIPFGIHFEG